MSQLTPHPAPLSRHTRPAPVPPTALTPAWCWRAGCQPRRRLCAVDGPPLLHLQRVDQLPHRPLTGSGLSVLVMASPAVALTAPVVKVTRLLPLSGSARRLSTSAVFLSWPLAVWP